MAPPGRPVVQVGAADHYRTVMQYRGGGGLAETAVVILPVQTASEAAVAAVTCSVVTAGLAVPSTKAAVSAGHSHGDSMVLPGVASVARAGRQPPAQLVHQLRGRRTDDPGRLCCESHTNVCFAIVVLCVFRKCCTYTGTLPTFDIFKYLFVLFHECTDFADFACIRFSTSSGSWHFSTVFLSSWHGNF